MRKNSFYMIAAVCVTFLLFSILPAHDAYSAKLFYTIQTASFSSVSDAEKQYDSIVNKLDDNQLDHLRIEKIGKFYSVRLGKFMDSPSADSFYQTVKNSLPRSTVMSAYIKDERIVKIYAQSAPSKVKEPEKDSSSVTAQDRVKPKSIKKADSKVSGESLGAATETVIEINKKKTENSTPSGNSGEKIKPQLAGNMHNKELALSLRENLEIIKTLVKNNDYAAALDIATKAITKDPEHPDLNAWVGMVLLKMDKPSEALTYLEKASMLSPKIPDYHNSLGYSLFFLDRYDESIDEFNKTIRLDPGHIDALTGLCIAYAKNHNKEKAMDIYHKIKDTDKETSQQLLTIINQ